MISYESQIIGTIHDKIGNIRDNLRIIVPDNKPIPEKFTIMRDIEDIEELLLSGTIE